MRSALNSLSEIKYTKENRRWRNMNMNIKMKIKQKINSNEVNVFLFITIVIMHIDEYKKPNRYN